MCAAASPMTQAHTRSHSAHISLYYNDHGTHAQLLSPKCTTLFIYFIYYVLCYYDYSLIIFSYHNDVRSPEAQIKEN